MPPCPTPTSRSPCAPTWPMRRRSTPRSVVPCATRWATCRPKSAGAGSRTPSRSPARTRTRCAIWPCSASRTGSRSTPAWWRERGRRTRPARSRLAWRSRKRPPSRCARRVGDELELTSRLDASMVVSVRISGIYHVDRPDRSVLVGGPAAAGRGQHQRPLPDDRPAARHARQRARARRRRHRGLHLARLPGLRRAGRGRDIRPAGSAARPVATAAERAARRDAARRDPAGTDPGPLRALAAGQPHGRPAADHPAGGAGRLRHRADRQPAGRAPPRAHRPAALAGRRHRSRSPGWR